MSDKRQLGKLEKVRDYQQSRLEILQSQLQSQLAIVNGHETQKHELERELQDSESRFESAAPSIANRLLAGTTLAQMKQSIMAENEKLTLARQELENFRKAVVAQMSKVESMKKLVERKSLAIEDEQRRQTQLVADDRYLNTLTTETNL